MTGRVTSVAPQPTPQTPPPPSPPPEASQHPPDTPPWASPTEAAPTLVETTGKTSVAPPVEPVEDSSPFEQLPEDFWAHDEAPPPGPPRVEVASARPAESNGSGSRSDPRFALLQELFSGRIIDVQELSSEDESGATDESAEEALDLSVEREADPDTDHDADHDTNHDANHNLEA